jgi:hypothetical protein
MTNAKFRQAKFNPQTGEFKGFHYWGLINGTFIGVDTGILNPSSAVNNSQQYTTRNDATGAELYDGDIIVFKFIIKDDRFLEFTGKIVWDQYMWLVETQEGDVFSLNRIHGIQVIGNIFENPNLLK